MQEFTENYCKIRMQGMQDNQEARAKGRIGISERNETFTSIARAQAHLYILTFHTL